MEEKDFLNKMENLKKPEVNVESSQSQIKLALMNTKRSAAWGIWFLIIPIVFLVCVIIKYLFRWNWGIAESFIEWAAKLDKKAGTAWLTPVVFVLLPAFGAIVNLLAIMHFVYDRITKQVIITIKIKWLNIILAIISIGFIAMILLYAVGENSAERAIKKYDAEWRLK